MAMRISNRRTVLQYAAIAVVALTAACSPATNTTKATADVSDGGGGEPAMSQPQPANFWRFSSVLSYKPKIAPYLKINKLKNLAKTCFFTLRSQTHNKTDVPLKLQTFVTFGI